MDEETRHGGPSKTAERERTLRLFHCRRPESVLSIAHIASLAAEHIVFQLSIWRQFMKTWAKPIAMTTRTGARMRVSFSNDAACVRDNKIDARCHGNFERNRKKNLFPLSLSLSLSVHPNDIDRCSESWRNVLADQKSQHRHHLCAFNGWSERDSWFLFCVHATTSRRLQPPTVKWHSWCCPGTTYWWKGQKKQMIPIQFDLDFFLGKSRSHGRPVDDVAIALEQQVSANTAYKIRFGSGTIRLDTLHEKAPCNCCILTRHIVN